MVQALLAFVAAAGATFYFSWVVFNDLAHSELSHTRCAPNARRRERPAIFWTILSVSAALALIFAWFALDAVYRIVLHIAQS
ncbi:MAG: hypothetical protein AB7P07_04325 [Hyphomonadaceae bacterium]